MLRKLPFKWLALDGTRVSVNLRTITEKFAAGYPTLGKYEGGRIVIDPHQTRDDAVDTCVHEVLHAACEHGGLSRRLRKPEEELVVSLLTPWFVALLCEENRDFIEWVIRRGEDA